MPRSPPQSEHKTKPSPESSEARLRTGSHLPGRDLAQRHDATVQYSAPTLPPVASLTGYGSTGSQLLPMGDTAPIVSLRPFGVHGMLNHPGDVGHALPARRVSQSPARSISTFGSHPTPIMSPRVRKRGDAASPGRVSQTPLDARQGRRMLTPKSPSLRSISQGVRGSPSGGSRMINALGEGRVYTAEQGDISAGHIPPLPPISLGSYGHHGLPQPHDQFNNAGPGIHGISTTPYSSNNQGYVGSPDTSSSTNTGDRETPPPFRPNYSDSIPRSSSSHHHAIGTEAQSRVPSRAYGAGQPAYQMQISTDQGPVAIPVEIDLQQASKSADEKRKRNAGASARFRQRRKEKEHAASSHISDLQRELRSLGDQRDYYRSERNFLRDMMARMPGIQVPPRPPSPQARSTGGASMTAASEVLPATEYSRHEMTEASPAQRRRTSDYQSSFVAGPMSSGAYPSSYAPPPPASSGYALPPPSLSAPMQDPRNQAPNTFMPSHGSQQAPPLPPTALRPPQHDPFRRDMNAR